MQPLYSIGHGSRKADVFISLLQQHHIHYLIDVRSKPQSRFHPQFNRAALETLLASHSIRYVFMGDQLGGRPKEPHLYDDKGQVSYQKIAGQDWYQEGIARLQKASSQADRCAIMCSERDPADCHRTRLIGESLRQLGIQLLHISEDGSLKTQQAVMEKIRKKKDPNGPLFDLP
jgi:uncharacterized protein (DUF488 family)